MVSPSSNPGTLQFTARDLGSLGSPPCTLVLLSENWGLQQFLSHGQVLKTEVTLKISLERYLIQSILLIINCYFCDGSCYPGISYLIWEIYTSEQLQENCRMNNTRVEQGQSRQPSQQWWHLSCILEHRQELSKPQGI